MGSIPALPTFAAGTVGSATALNALRDAVNFWALTPRCYAFQATSQSMPNFAGTVTAVTLDAEIYDVPNALSPGDAPMHDNSTLNTRIYIRTPGKYRISGQIMFAPNSAGHRVAGVRLNGTTLIVQTSAAAVAVAGISTTTLFTPITVPLNVGDYVELVGEQSSGGALAIERYRQNTFLQVELAAA